MQPSAKHVHVAEREGGFVVRPRDARTRPHILQKAVQGPLANVQVPCLTVSRLCCFWSPKLRTNVRYFSCTVLSLSSYITVASVASTLSTRYIDFIWTSSLLVCVCVCIGYVQLIAACKCNISPVLRFSLLRI